MRVLVRHWPIVLLAAVAGVLLFTGLGNDHLWEDEGDTAVLARNILREGLPVAWDGVTFVAPDYGQRLKFGFVMVSHPWLQYYAAAASFAMFGDTPWAARAPFALAGLATILLVYSMTWSLFRDRRAAISSALLLTASVQFLLFSRQARNYAFNALLTCLLIWQFQRLRSWKDAAAFAGIGVLLFHAHSIGIVAVAALAAIALVCPPPMLVRRRFWCACFGMALYIAPWLVGSRTGHDQSTVLLRTATELGPRIVQFAVEYASVTPAIGAIVLYLVLRFVYRRRAVSCERKERRSHGDGPLFTLEERSFVAACAAVIVSEAVVMAVTHTPNDIWVLGLHHTPALIPLTIVVTALLVGKVSGRSRRLWVALMLLLGVTRMGQVVPWAFAAEPTPVRDPSTLATFHVPDQPAGRMLRTTQIEFVRSLVRPNPGVIARISAYLDAHAAPGDIVITNYSWEPLYFHTRLPQGAKVSPSFPIYRVARANNLPDYVFGADRVRWIVWRRAWPAYFREQDCEQLLKRLTKAGVTTELVASITETLFENRENIHFRRYADGAYVFPWYPNLPDVLIYRVDWESDTEAHHQRANALFAREEFEKAIVTYREYLSRRPHDIDAVSRLAIALLATGDTDNAIRVFRQVVDIDPANAGARRNLANALFDAGQPREAYEHARRAAALKPNDPAAYDVLGRTLAQLGRLNEAISQFQRAVEIDPAYMDAVEHLRVARRAATR
jgi:hypothetical protein